MKLITQHEECQRINGFIVYLKTSGKGFRVISDCIELEFGLKVSHTSVQKYYLSHLNGKAIEEGLANRSSAEGAILEGGEGEELGFSQEVYERSLEELNENWRTEGVAAEYAELYAQTLALVSANMQEHRRGEARLKTEYVKYLKELRGLYHKPLAGK